MHLKSRDVFKGFEQLAAFGSRAAALLEIQLAEPSRVAELARALRDLEHQADAEARRIYTELRTQIMPPIGPLAIRRLVSALDDVVDAVEEVAARVDLYDVGAIPPAAHALAGAVVLACREVAGGVAAFRNFRVAEPILAACRAIGEREREADRLLRGALADLFANERDALVVLKWSELYQLMEVATDRCDDVANMMEGIVIEEI